MAVIEPGVTQRQLYDFLQANCPGLTFNVTGAGGATSILGNALDRGVGYFGPRKDDVFGLELVTGTGEILQTGFRRLGESSPLAHSHPFGLGPMIDGIFFQSNFGIVTSACFRLLPRRPIEVAVSMALRKPEDLAGFIDELARIKRDGLLTSVTHIGNRPRTHSTLMYGILRSLERRGLSAAEAASEAERVLEIVAPNAWTSLAAVTGNRGQVNSAIREIRARIGRHAVIRVVTERRLDVGAALLRPFNFLPAARAQAAAIDAVRPLHSLALGVPTDVAIDNLLWKFGAPGQHPTTLDQSRCGLLFINPALPADGRRVAALVRDLEAIGDRYRHRLYMTINIETMTSLVAVINLLFERDQPEQVERAHRCADDLFACIREHGLEVYRARADMMHQVVEDNAYWQTIRRLKDVFDPDNVIAPGRYNLPL